MHGPTKPEARGADHVLRVRSQATAGGVQPEAHLAINLQLTACADVTAWRRAAPRQIELYARARATTVITFVLVPVRRLQSMPRKEWGPRNRQSLLLLHPGQQQWSSNSVVLWLVQHKLL